MNDKNLPPIDSTDAELRKKTIQSVLAVSFYMTVSIALVFLNRFVLF